MKNRFWIVELAALAISAFFVGSGVSEMVAGEMAGSEQVGMIAEGPMPVRARPRPAPERSAIDGTPILERNIFDSQTGPIGKDRGGQDAGNAPAAEDTSGFVEVRRCAAGPLKILTTVVQADDAESFALLGSGTGTSYCKAGTDFAGHTVEKIGWRYVILRDRVGGLCYLDLIGLDDPLYLVREPGEKAAATGGAAAAGGTKAAADKVALDFAGAVRNMAPGVWQVDEKLMSRPIERIEESLGFVQVLPHSDPDAEGAQDGFTLHGIRLGSLLDRMGLRNGDLVTRVGGMELASPEAGAAALALLHKRGETLVSVERDGKPISIRLQVR
ncbi:MAG: type II secretion system protein GspC [Deltaproteobacteria bacterium]|nr:type II secretion system protein GspC [Deltaproteobacteria bacterium]